MRILTRYVLGELLSVFLLTLAGMTTLIFVALVGKEAVDKGIGLGPLVRMTPYLLPQAMQFAVPGTMLLAVTSVFGRISSSNEMVAIKSMGVSPWALAAPALVLATLVSLIAVLLNDIAVSWGRLGVQRVFLESLEDVVYGQLRVHKTYSNGRLQINVRTVDETTRQLIQPTISINGSKSQEPWSISAEWAELASSDNGEELSVRMHNIEVDGPVDIADGDTVEQAISLDQFLGTESDGRSPSTYALSEIGPALMRQEEVLGDLRADQTAEAALAMITGDLDQLSEAAWRPREQRLGSAEFTKHRLHAEPFRRWATGFSCLAFVMVGVPVSVIFRKGEFLASFFMCFAPILIVYYPLLMVSVDKAKGGAIPPVSVWLGNVVLAAAGAYLMRRVIRY